MDFLGIDVEQTLISAGTENDLLTPQSLLNPAIDSQKSVTLLPETSMSTHSFGEKVQ